MKSVILVFLDCKGKRQVKINEWIRQWNEEKKNNIAQVIRILQSFRILKREKHKAPEHDPILAPMSTK